MSIPRLMVCGLEPGPAVALAAGALLASFGEAGATRPVSIGLDLPLWRLLTISAQKSPRLFDRALHDDDTLAELFSSWMTGCDAALMVAVEPALDRWHGVSGSRPVDVAAAFDAPLVVVLDARGRGPTAAAALFGLRTLAGRVQIAGVILVGGEDQGAGAGLAASVRRDAGLAILGWIPERVTEQFAQRYGAEAGGASPGGGHSADEVLRHLCTEAARSLDAEALAAAAAVSVFLPAPARRTLALYAPAADLTLALAWGAPLEPMGLENIDVLRALGLRLAPFDLAHDRELPPGTSGLLLAGQLDESELPGFAGNQELRACLMGAIAGGLPTLALGGGALLLLNRLADSRGQSTELLGLVPAEAELLEWYDRPRYVRARATRDNPYDEGDNLLYELFDLEFLVLEQDAFAYRVGESDGAAGQAEGFVIGRCLATTLFPSLPRCPRLAERFVNAMREAGAGA